MKKNILLKKTILFLLLLISFVLKAGGSDWISLNRFLEEEQAVCHWNPVTETGWIEKQDNIAAFQVDSPYIVLDFEKMVYTEKVTKRRGEIFLHSKSVAAIKQYYKEQAAFLQGISVILIDPGHGGKDPGAVGTFVTKSGKFVVKEKDVVLNTSKKLYTMLKARYPRKKILLTRDDDRFLKLEERVRIANNTDIADNEAILFISIHANSGFKSSAKGFEVWHLPAGYRRKVIDEKDLLPEEKEILPILNNMLEEEYSIESINLAGNILDNMNRTIGSYTENRGLKAESWFVVRKANMPSVLIEVGFVSNKEEAMRLSEEFYLNKLASGIYNGVCEFITRFENTKGFTE